MDDNTIFLPTTFTLLKVNKIQNLPSAIFLTLCRVPTLLPGTIQHVYGCRQITFSADSVQKAQMPILLPNQQHQSIEGIHTHTHICLTAFFPGNLGKPAPER